MPICHGTAVRNSWTYVGFYWFCVAALSFGATAGQAQTSAPAAKKAPASQPATDLAASLATLQAQAAKYQQVLKENTDTDITPALSARLLEVNCQVKVLTLRQKLGFTDSKLEDAVQQSCMGHPQSQPAATIAGTPAPVTTSSSTPVAPSAAPAATAPAPAASPTAPAVVATAPAPSPSPSVTPAPSNPQNPVSKSQTATTCPNALTDSTVATPSLTAPITVGTATSVSVAGTVPKATDGKVQLCLGSQPLGGAVDVGKDGGFTVPLQNSSSPYPKSGDKIQAQYTNASGVSGPASAPARVDSCAALKADGTQSPTLKFDPSTNTYSGTLPGATSTDSIQICINDVEKVPAFKVDSPTGNSATFSSKGPAPKPGDVAVAQKADGTSPNVTYGPVSNELGLGTCSSSWKGDSSNIATLQKPVGDSTVIKGSFASPQSGMVRICVGDAEAAVVPINSDGTFTAVLAHTPKQRITAQLITSAISDFPRTYGAPSPGVRPGFLYSDKIVADFVGGVEQSGFSSQISNTNGFLSAFFRSRYFGGDQNVIAPTLWGRIRLLSGPLPSATATSGNGGTSFNFIGALTNPQGTITSSNLTNVGQVVDYVFGPELRIHQRDREDESTDRLSFVVGVGATTPLASSNIQFSLQAPTANTQQCQQLLTIYPTYFTNVSTAPGCQLGNLASKTTPSGGGAPTYTTVTTLSFAPIDRTNFLAKYGAGIRFTHIYPAKGQQPAYAGSIDFAIGQDESITGGRFHGAVFRVDGVYPLAFGASGYLYMFGSASMRLSGNTSSMPLVLGTAPAPSLPLASSVVVLPLQQPNRDFYRFGVGLNLAAIFCKLSTSTSACSSSNANQSGSTDNTTTTKTNNTPAPATTAPAGGSAGTPPTKTP
jgi:hypothetical protein